MRTAFAFAAALLATSALQARSPTVHNPPSGFDSEVTALSATQVAGLGTSEEIVRQYLKRIADIDDSGPRLNAVIATFPDAIEQARRLDAERRAGKVRGPLHGIPVLVKDNIEVAGPVPTTVRTPPRSATATSTRNHGLTRRDMSPLNHAAVRVTGRVVTVTQSAASTCAAQVPPVYLQRCHSPGCGEVGE